MGQTSDTSERELDRRYEAALLLHLVVLHPMESALDELLRDLAGDDDPAAPERVRRAVERLAADGLVERRGSLVLPTRAALRSYELWEC